MCSLSASLRDTAGDSSAGKPIKDSLPARVFGLGCKRMCFVIMAAGHTKHENNTLLQALLSSSIMFSNFMSIYQRRAESKEKAEQSNR